MAELPDGGHLLAAIDELVAVAVAGDLASSTFGSSWPSLLITLRVPNSGGHVAQTAPRLAVARKATSVSGMLGR